MKDYKHYEKIHIDDEMSEEEKRELQILNNHIEYTNRRIKEINENNER